MSIFIDAMAALGLWCLASLIALVLFVVIRSAVGALRERARAQRERKRFLREAGAEVEALIGVPGKSGSDRRAA